MAIGRDEMRWIGGAAAVALLAAAAMVAAGLGGGDLPIGAATIPPIAAPAPPPADAAFRRILFGPAELAAEEAPADAPALAGIVGRIGGDAVALVRGTGGDTRTLAPGEAVDGWTLQSLALDAAFFTRGGQRVRVPLPAGDDSLPDQ